MEQLKHFAGKGLYRVVEEGLSTYSDAEKVAAEISSGTQGQSLIWKIDWKRDGEENAIEGTYNVYQKLMHEPKVLDAYAEAVKSPTQYAAECKEYARELRLSREIADVNDKVNISLIIGGVLAWLGIGAYGYNVAKFTGLESACLMLVVALAIMTLAWLWCINHTCDTR